jgi:hypothetical protein
MANGVSAMNGEQSDLDLSGSSGPFAFLPRPAGQLRSLSVPFRWEVTRRHPYYLNFWTSGRRYHLREPLSSESEGVIRKAAIAILGGIGVGGLPFDPAESFDQISAHPGAENWLEGTVHPVSCRGLISMLISALPARTLAEVGAFLTRHFTDEGTDGFGKFDALVEFCRFPDPQLDQYVDEPILSVSPSASLRALERDLPPAVSVWKDRPGQTEYRSHEACFEQFLRVWDLREGWSNGAYDNSKERMLREVAQELGISVSTVNNRYRSAFELITGHPYSPGTWLRVFGALKFSSDFTKAIGRVAARRPTRSPTRIDVPDSNLTPKDVSVGVVELFTAVSEDREATDLSIDIEERINSGMSNLEIAADFEIEASFAAEIEQIRRRFQDK